VGICFFNLSSCSKCFKQKDFCEILCEVFSTCNLHLHSLATHDISRHDPMSRVAA